MVCIFPTGGPQMLNCLAPVAAARRVAQKALCTDALTSQCQKCIQTRTTSFWYSPQQQDQHRCRHTLSSKGKPIRPGIWRRPHSSIAGVGKTDMMAGVSSICGGAGEELENAWCGAQELIAAGASEEAFTLLVGAAATVGDVSTARRLFLRLLALQEESQPMASNESSSCKIGRVPMPIWKALTASHARSGDTDAGFALLGWVEQLIAADPQESRRAELPLEVFEALITGLVHAKRTELAFETFQRLRTWALVEPTADLYVTMIRACGIARDPDRATEFYSQLEARHGTPGPEARLELVIALASRARTTRRAFRTFGDAIRRGDQVQQEVCRALAFACARGGLAEEAKLLQRRMHAVGLVLDVETQANFVRAFGKAAARCGTDRKHIHGKDSDDALVSNGRRLEGISSDRARLFAHAWGIVGDARKDGRVHVIVLDALLDAYCSVGLADHAAKLLGMYLDISGELPGVTAYAKVLEGLAEHPTRFRTLWAEILSSSAIRPTEAMLRRALTVAIATKDAWWVHSILQLMYTACVAPGREAAAAIHSSLRGPPGTGASEARALLRALEQQFPDTDLSLQQYP